MVNDYGILIVQSSLFYGLIAVTNHRYRNDGRINIMKAPKKNPKSPKIVKNCHKLKVCLEFAKNNVSNSILTYTSSRQRSKNFLNSSYIIEEFM